MLFKIFAVLLGISVHMWSHAAVDPYEFSSEKDRARYQRLVEELRCPKCKNNNLAGTNSQIAVDLRRELQKMVTNGDSDEQIINFMVSRYGDFVLYRPRMTGKTQYVWYGPVALLFLGLMALVTVVIKRRKVSKTEPVELSPDEQSQLQAILRPNSDSDENGLNDGKNNSNK